MNTPEDITSLKPNQIFVFGSNLAGIHGAGAARVALQSFGAKWGAGEGITGQCYAIPTKDKHLRVIALDDIEFDVGRLLTFAARHPDKEFLVTKIGCGYAGYSPSDIGPMFHPHPSNVILPKEFEP